MSDNKAVTPDDEPTTEEVMVRRAPKFPAFMFVGGAIGTIATLVLTSLFPVDPAVGFGALFGYFALFGVTGGVLLGALLAIVLDHRANKRTRAMVAEITVEQDD